MTVETKFTPPSDLPPLQQVCSIIYSGICIGQSRWGLGLPVELRPEENLNKYSVVRCPADSYHKS